VCVRDVISLCGQAYRNLAYQVLSWIFYAFHPLLLVELQYAVAIHKDMIEMDDEDLDDEEFLLSVCGGLVVLTKESKQVALVRKCIMLYLYMHLLTAADYSTQEYLE
jgi:hypothetical protein